MKNLCFLFFNLIFVCFSGFGQTNVSGNVSGIWTKANSPYIITADVTVPPGQTLTIQPGVEVRSADYADDLLYGTLVAQGTAADSIRFRGVVCQHQLDARWHGLLPDRKLEFNYGLRYR